jgi:hypothetical protein
MDNERLAEFIRALGAFDNYSSSVAKTKKRLENPKAPLDAKKDEVIFDDAVRAIRAVERDVFSVDSIIKINAQFTGDSSEQPENPGQLRDKAFANLYPNFHVDTGFDVYFPPKMVAKTDLDQLVSAFKALETPDDNAGWLLFADIARLQPFEDGNKRTALIAANHALGHLVDQQYLVPPLNGADFQVFNINLGRYYLAADGDERYGTKTEAMTVFLRSTKPMTLD